MTAQLHERLILDGKEVTMTGFPKLPDKHPRVVERGRQDTEGVVNQLSHSTACWRGYVGTWAIQNGLLFLVTVDGRYRLEGSAPLFADWFSGLLVIPRGEILRYVHMGFETVYERELVFEVESGVVKDRWEIENER